MFRLNRPSPAMVVALLAVVFSLGGSAIAARHFIITSTKQIKPNVLRKLKGNGGPRGFPGANGTNGTNGKDGTAVAYGDFDVNGTTPVVQQHTTPFNVSAANVDRRQVGIYCFKNLSFTPHSAMVSADSSGSGGSAIVSVLVVDPGSPILDCAPGENVRVQTVATPSGATYTPPSFEDRPFIIWFN